MPAGDLTSLANVKQWLSISNVDTDVIFKRLITAVSSDLRSYINRYSLISATLSETRDGTGTQSMVLKGWPVTSIQSLFIGNVPVPPATPYVVNGVTVYGGAGYFLEPWDGNEPGVPQCLKLRGYCYWQENQNVQVAYTSGYLSPTEAMAVPAGVGSAEPAYSVLAPKGIWAADNGVSYTDSGAAGVYVPTTVSGSPPTLSTGQYSYDPVLLGTYYFATVDAGRPVKLQYSYTPPGLEQIAIEMVGERNSYRTRIGQRSKSLGGQETVSFDLSGIPMWAQRQLQPYLSVVPV